MLQPAKNGESRETMTIRRRGSDPEGKSLHAKLSACDMLAQEATYHTKYQAGLRGLEHMVNSILSDKDMSHSITPAEHVSYTV